MQKLKEYQELIITLNGQDKDLLSGLFQQAGCLGILENSDATWTVYFPGDWQRDQFQNLASALQRAFPDFITNQLSLDRKPYRDWNAEWKKFFTPKEMVPGVWVRPPWEDLPPDAKGYRLIIDPQMAFGTGHHETTRLMMMILLEHSPANKRILDLGCGSGILAILAKQLGAKSVLRVDHDPEAIDNARHNAKLNNCAGISFSVGEIDAVQGEFDIVLANIHFDVLKDIATPLKAHLAPGGLLFLSGLLQTDLPATFDIYEAAGFQNFERLNLQEWAALGWTQQ